MKRLHAGIAVLLGGVILLTLGAQDTVATKQNPKVVLGTFDSRAIAVAYVSSDAFSERLHELRATLELAREAGDAERVAELEALGPAMQRQIHQQGFGTAAVDDILARIEDRIPGIAKAAGVDVIVSKWNLVYRNPAARSVDVTYQLIAPFAPDEATLKTIKELLAQEPVPIEDLDH